ncbi:MAG: DNA lyase [Bacteroidota bacterium]
MAPRTLSKQSQELIRLYSTKKDAIRIRLVDFTQIPPAGYFYELLYCLMTPQSSAENAEHVVGILRNLQFETTDLDPEPILRSKEHYIRFHRTKARLLSKVKSEMPVITGVLYNGSPAWDMREWLVRNVKGLGYKEATHFLRNIGKNGGLAILDRHILRNLKRYGIIRTIPKSLSKKQYYRIEKRFSEFAAQIGIPLDHLDLLFWSMETGQIRK